MLTNNYCWLFLVDIGIRFGILKTKNPTQHHLNGILVEVSVFVISWLLSLVILLARRNRRLSRLTYLNILHSKGNLYSPNRLSFLFKYSVIGEYGAKKEAAPPNPFSGRTSIRLLLAHRFSEYYLFGNKIEPPCPCSSFYSGLAVVLSFYVNSSFIS